MIVAKARSGPVERMTQALGCAGPESQPKTRGSTELICSEVVAATAAEYVSAAATAPRFRATALRAAETRSIET